MSEEEDHFLRVGGGSSGEHDRHPNRRSSRSSSSSRICCSYFTQNPIGRFIAIGLVVGILIIIGYVVFLSSSSPPKKKFDWDKLSIHRSNRTAHQPHHTYPMTEGQTFNDLGRTLVLYVFSNNDEPYLSNLEYFISTAVVENPHIEYLIILNQEEPTREEEEAQFGGEWNPNTQRWTRQRYVHHKYLPPLPSNARYLEHKNECFDLGTIGWVLGLIDFVSFKHAHAGAVHGDREIPLYYSPEKHDHLGKLALELFSYFVILNSSIRGPYFPRYMPMNYQGLSWVYPWMNMMHRDQSLKLVGCTVSCQYTPHVQSYFLFTDTQGLNIMRTAGTFECQTNHIDAVCNGELGASWSILSAGYNIGALLPASQYAEFRGVSKDGTVYGDYCASIPEDERIDRSQYPPDGVPLNLYDLVFVKYQSKRELVPTVMEEEKWTAAIEARVADRKKSHQLQKGKPISHEVDEAHKQMIDSWKAKGVVGHI